MQVSTVTANSSRTVFNTKASNKTWDNFNKVDAKFERLNSSKISSVDNKSKMYDSINEWKNFCHAQIEKGNFDVII